MNEKRAESGIRRLNIPQPKTSIDENESLVCLNKQTMTDKASAQTSTETIKKCPTKGTHTAAIEMMNMHEFSEPF
jgi:hypothetical protein